MVTPSKVEDMETNFDLTKPRHSKLILPVPEYHLVCSNHFRPASRFCLDFSYLKKRKSETSFCPLSSNNIRQVRIYSQSPLYKTTTGCPSQPSKGRFFIPYSYLIRLSPKIFIFFITWLALLTVFTIVTAHIFYACQGSRARRERNAQHAGHADWFCLL